MYHSITFGDKNTWTDWHLIPASRPVFNPPEVKRVELDIPGGDGVIDLTSSLTGYPVYKNRTGTFEFYVMNGYGNWAQRYSEIMNYLHGRRMRAILEDDKHYFYDGRYTVDNWAPEKDRSKIVIGYNVNPYKWSIESSIGNWLWDPFSFVDGTIRTSLFKNISADTTKTEHKFNQKSLSNAPTSPVFSVTSSDGRGVHMQFVNPNLGIDETKLLPDGNSYFPEFVLYGELPISIFLWCDTGTGSVSIDFREGRL